MEIDIPPVELDPPSSLVSQRVERWVSTTALFKLANPFLHTDSEEESTGSAVVDIQDGRATDQPRDIPSDTALRDSSSGDEATPRSDHNDSPSSLLVDHPVAHPWGRNEGDVSDVFAFNPPETSAPPISFVQQSNSFGSHQMVQSARIPIKEHILRSHRTLCPRLQSRREYKSHVEVFQDPTASPIECRLQGCRANRGYHSHSSYSSSAESEESSDFVLPMSRIHKKTRARISKPVFIHPDRKRPVIVPINGGKGGYYLFPPAGEITESESASLGEYQPLTSGESGGSASPLLLHSPTRLTTRDERNKERVKKRKSIGYRRKIR